MATKRFIEKSPYSRPAPQPTKEDYLYKSYIDDLTTSDKNKADRPLKVAIFGIGRAGTIHLTGVMENPRTELLYIVEDMESRWKDLKTYWKLDNVMFLTSKDADKVYNDPRIDAVIVTSPTHSHEGIVRKALAAKKSVFCEKPIANDRQSTMNCYETAVKNGKALFCAFNRRFDPSYSNVKERVRNGEVGHVHMIKTVARDSPLPSIEYLRTSGGIFHDCIVHDIDLITWCIGEYPCKVTAFGSANIPEIREIKDFDTVGIIFQFPSGTLGMVDISRNAVYGYDQRLEVFGPKGMISATNEQPMHCVAAQLGQNGLVTPPIWYSFPSRFRLAYRRELDHFIDVALGKVQPSVNAKEILAVSKIASALEQSVRSGCPVELQWADGELPPQN